MTDPAAAAAMDQVSEAPVTVESEYLLAECAHAIGRGGAGGIPVASLRV